MRPRLDRCRRCGRDGIDAHRADCPLTPDDPLPDDPALDETRIAQAVTEYENQRIGEGR